MLEDTSLRREVLGALEAPEALLDHLDELLADLPDLGTDPTAVVDLLRTAGLGHGARVLDLGCGSGIVAVALARELGAHVEAIDGYPPFIVRARARAEAAGVADRCRFTTGDLRGAVHGSGAFDGLVFGAVGDVLGSLAETVRRLRAELRPGGYLVLDHAFATSQASASPGFPTLAEARAALSAAGDGLIAEQIPDEPAVRATNERNNRLLAARAADLSTRVPEIAPALQTYLDRQKVECERLETMLRPVLWLVRRDD